MKWYAVVNTKDGYKIKKVSPDSKIVRHGLYANLAKALEVCDTLNRRAYMIEPSVT